jgi:hypothetical protein
MACPDILTCDYSCLRRGICDHKSRSRAVAPQLAPASEAADPVDALIDFILDDQRPVTDEDRADIELFDRAIAAAQAKGAK